MLRVTPEQAEVLDALQRGRQSPEIFAHDVLGVHLNPAQRRWFSLIGPADDGWSWTNKVVLHVAANQIGKSLGLSILVLWACMYKIGVPIADPKRWFGAPYQFFHVAPSQNQAYLVLHDISLLIQGVHPAQTSDFRLPKGLISEVKVETYYDGLSFYNGAIAQFRTTEDKAKALQGRRASAISFDECAFEDHLKTVVNEVLMMRLIASGGPLWLVSTPNGINDWFEMVQSVLEDADPRQRAEEGDPLLGGSALASEFLPLWFTSENWALIWSTVADNIGFGISAEEAARMERDLDETTKEQQLRGAFLEPADAFFVPVRNVLRAFRNLPEFVEPQPGHRYVISWDPSFASDPTAVIVIDITTIPWRGVYFKYYPKPIGDTRFLMEVFALHALYNGATRDGRGSRPQAITVYDETSMGGAMLKQQLVRLSPRRGVNLAGPSMKINLLTNLRTAINAGTIHLPKSWVQAQRELLNYKLPDTKIKQDTVMALVAAAGVAASGWAGIGSNVFRPSGRVTPRSH